MLFTKTISMEDPKLRLHKGEFPTGIKKLLAIAGGIVLPKTDQEVFKTKSNCICLNPSTVCWKERLVVKVVAEKQLSFEIRDVHQFGFAPEKLKGVLSGTIKVYTEREKQRFWDVFDSEGQRVGTLTALVSDQFHVDKPTRQDIETPFDKNTISSVVDNKIYRKSEGPSVGNAQFKKSRKYVTIHSIIGNLSKIVDGLESAMVEVKAGERRVRTSPSKGQTTQHAWVDTLKFVLSPTVNHMDLTVIGKEGIEQLVICTGEVNMEIFTERKRWVSLRVELKNGQGLAGQMFVDISCQTQADRLFLHQDLLQRKPRYFASIQPKSRSPSPGSRGSLEGSRLSQSRSRHPSVVIPNNSIVFSKQPRFVNYVDRQNPIISYLQDEFAMSGRSTKGRGAHIGYGSKEDFTKSTRKVPGVGEYKLPSIWDRY